MGLRFNVWPQVIEGRGMGSNPFQCVNECGSRFNSGQNRDTELDRFSTDLVFIIEHPNISFNRRGRRNIYNEIDLPSK